MGSMLPHGSGRPLLAEAREAHLDTTVGGSGDHDDQEGGDGRVRSNLRTLVRGVTKVIRIP